jgi:tetratricopeptide (TPR) repeat protein
LLEEKTIDVDLTQRTGGSTALHLATSFGNIEVIRMLLEKGANTKIVNSAGQDVIACTERCLKTERIDQMRKMILDAREAARTPQRRAQENRHKLRGNDAFQRGDYKKAVSEYTMAMDFNQMSPILWCNRAAAHLGLKNYRAAYDDARMAVKMDDKYIKAHYREAQALYGLHILHPAKESCQRALELSPGDPTLTALLGEITDLLFQISASTGDPDLAPSRYFPPNTVRASKFLMHQEFLSDTVLIRRRNYTAKEGVWDIKWINEDEVDKKFDRDEKNKNKLCLGLVKDFKLISSRCDDWFQFDQFPTTLVDLKRDLSLQALEFVNRGFGSYGHTFCWREKNGKSLQPEEIFFVDEDDVTGARSLRPMVSDAHVGSLKDGDRIHIRWSDDAPYKDLKSAKN